LVDSSALCFAESRDDLPDSVRVIQRPDQTLKGEEDWKENVSAIVRVLQLANPSADNYTMAEVALNQIGKEDRVTTVIFTTEGEDEISAEDILDLIEGQPIDSWWMDLALSAMQAKASKRTYRQGLVPHGWKRREFGRDQDITWMIG
jgi:hypothetical protein